MLADITATTTKTVYGQKTIMTLTFENSTILTYAISSKQAEELEKAGLIINYEE